MKKGVPSPEEAEAKAIVDLENQLAGIERLVKSGPLYGDPSPSTQEKDLVEAILDLVPSYRLHVAARHWHTAAFLAYRIGVVTCQIGLDPFIQMHRRARNAQKVRDKGKAAKVQARRERWIKDAQAILNAEPKTSRRQVAERIVKQEEKRKLPDSCKWRAVYDAIGCIFQK